MQVEVPRTQVLHSCQNAIVDLGVYPPGMSTHSVGSVPINARGTREIRTPAAYQR
jgi:hypothetical protein